MKLVMYFQTIVELRNIKRLKHGPMSYFYLKSEVFIKKKFIHVCFRFTYNFYIGVAENKCVFVFDAFPFG